MTDKNFTEASPEPSQPVCGTCKRARITSIVAYTSLGVCGECGQSYGVVGAASSMEIAEKFIESIPARESFPINRTETVQLLAKFHATMAPPSSPSPQPATPISYACRHGQFAKPCTICTGTVTNSARVEDEPSRAFMSAEEIFESCARIVENAPLFWIGGAVNRRDVAAEIRAAFKEWQSRKA